MNNINGSKSYSKSSPINGSGHEQPGAGTPWGAAGCPLVPRPYRRSHGGVEAPASLKRLAQDDNLLLGDLDRNFLERVAQPTLVGAARKRLGECLTALPVPLTDVAIPAGFPLQLLSDLPFRSRTRNAVDRFVRSNQPGRLQRPLLVSEVMEWPAVGPKTLIDLLCVIESTELAPAETRPYMPKPVEHLMVPATFREIPILAGIAAWARSESKAETLGDALDLLKEKVTTLEEWDSLAKVRLQDLSVAPPDPFQVLERWVAKLSDREARIFRFRQGPLEERRPTLKETADLVGLTHQRVRQIEQSLMNRLINFCDTIPGRPISHQVDSIQRRLGVAAPQVLVKSALESPPNTPDYSRVFLTLAGPYLRDGSWWKHKATAADDPTLAILDRADRFGRIDYQSARRSLARWGMREDLMDLWLTRNNRCRLLRGQMVRWRGPITDKCALALDDHQRPMTVDEMLEYLEIKRSPRSTGNVLSRDGRFVRTSMNHWALSEWDYPEYQGIAASMKSILEEKGSMLLDDLAEQMYETFGARETSVRSYARAAAFVLEKGRIRMRSPDEKYVYPAESPRNTRGVFILGRERVGLLIKINHDLIRGSGRRLGTPAAKALGVKPNDSLRFESADGNHISITFPDTRMDGPALGSGRPFALAGQGEIEDFLLLILDRSDMSLVARVIHQDDLVPGWALVERLTGIEPGSGMAGLAKALKCEPTQVKSVLYRRGDWTVARAIPGADKGTS